MRTLILSLSTVLLVALLAACVTTSSDDGDDDVVDEPTQEVAAEEDPTATPEPVDEDPTATPEEEADPTATPEEEVDPTATPEQEDDPTATPEEDDDGNGEPAEHTIEMQDPDSFSPDELEIAAGDTVTFVNAGNIVHTSTLDPEVARDESNAVLPDGAETWDSGDMEPGDEFSITLDVPGEYVYFCRPHEALGMVGTITVTDGEGGDDNADEDSGNADDDSDDDENEDDDYL